jgi:molecular chaperone GrpE
MEKDNPQTNEEALANNTTAQPIPNQTPDHLAEMKDLLLRTQANFENFRKQTERRIEEIKEMAARDTILQLLPILDDLELAFKNLDPKLENETFVQGIKLIYSQFSQILEKNEVKSIPTQKQKFDPYLHEALMKIESDAPENTILEEFQKGYTLRGRMLRHAKVKISAGKKKE